MRQHASEAAASGSLTGMEGAHIPPRHWGGSHPDKRPPPATQPSDQAAAAEMPSYDLGRNTELGAVMRKEVKRYSQMTTRNVS